MTPSPLTALALAVLALACGETKPEPIVLRPAAVVPSATPVVAGVRTGAVERIDLAKEKEKYDQKKGDKQDPEWVPKEFTKGASRWKDTGVYVDGKPVGFLSWGELPLSLKPTWVRDKISANKRPGTNDPGWRWAQQRFYKFTDYLEAVGVDVRRVKEMHVYGPKFSQSVIATAKDLQTPLAQGFMFRFGGNVFGKAIPQVPTGFANGKTPDKIAGVMIYVEKEPPRLVFNEGFTFDTPNMPTRAACKRDNSGLTNCDLNEVCVDGVCTRLEMGVPYYGEPIRGGIRVYLDEKLATIIKRQELDPTKATKNADGNLTWSLAELFAAQGVDTRKVVEMWVIRDERRHERLPASELASLTFTASSQAKGGIMLDDKVRANALALSTREISLDELPVITPDDD